jgi:1-acyl-sn-glycerol-3-phosphate acyltransferase
VTTDATRFQLWFYKVARAVLAGFCYTFWRARFEGREYVPRSGAFVLSPVHRSNIDTPLMGCVTRRRMHFLGKESMWKYGWSAWLFTSLGAIPIRRGGADREALRACEEAVRAGEPVVIFPEGTRKSGPVVDDIFEGAAFVALRAGVPIVPVGIGGSEAAMPRGTKLLRPVKIRVVIGPPFYPMTRDSGQRVTRREVRELSERLHAELQRLFDQARKAAAD